VIIHIKEYETKKKARLMHTTNKATELRLEMVEFSIKINPEHFQMLNPLPLQYSAYSHRGKLPEYGDFATIHLAIFVALIPLALRSVVETNVNANTATRDMHHICAALFSHNVFSVIVF
jgi:hypothetical protein